MSTIQVERLILTKKIFIGVLSSLLIIPVDIIGGSGPNFAAPVSMLIIPIAIFSFLKSFSLESVLLKVAILIACLSIFVTLPFTSDFSLKPIASLLSFFAPSTLYFLSRSKIKTNSEFEFFLRSSFYASIVLDIALFLSVFIFGDGIVRSEGTMMGSFFSLPLTGAYGTHTLTAHFFLICIVVIYFAKSGFANKAERYCSSLVVLFLTYMMILSLSRETLLAIVFVTIVGLIRYLNFLKAFVVIASFILFIYLNVDNIVGVDSAWATKIAQTLGADDLNDLSSGRLELQGIALEQFVRRPFSGTGFHGYELDYRSSELYEDLRGWSTHLYYLTTIWKMGVIAGLAFFIFLIKIIMDSVNFSEKYFPESAKLYTAAMLAFLIFINMLWDALLAVNVMCLFAFFVGSMRMRVGVNLK